MVSKAAVRSRRMKMVRWLESAERRRSLGTFRRAVSVLCWEWIEMVQTGHLSRRGL